MQKRTLFALLSLSVLIFCAVGAAYSNVNTREIRLTEERVVDPQVDTVEAATVVAPVEENAQTQEAHEDVAKPQPRRTYNARASWYKHGRVTANGERYDPMGFTVAHRSLPFGTVVKFTNMDNGRSITVRVNDRGPYIRGREFDLSLGSARALDMEKIGVMMLRVEVF